MTTRKYKTGIHRQQAFLLPPTLDDYVTQDNPVRAIDAYVETLDLAALGFQHATGELTSGQPAFPPGALLKLYLYGYLQRIHSSRRLEAECKRNTEVLWLLETLQPCYKTISDFRKDNLQPLKKVNCDFVKLCKELSLFGAELVGIDGSFFRGNVAKKRIFNERRLERILQAIEQDITQYLQELDAADQQEDQPATAGRALAEKLEQLRARQQQRQEQLQQLQASGETQIAEVDPDARLLRKGSSSTVAGYNVQTVVDGKHKLLVCAEVVQDGNDSQQLLPMAQAAQAELEVEQLEAVADTGYFNAQQIQACLEQGITPYVPAADKQAQTRQQGRFVREDFHYESETQHYTCPNDQVLRRHGIRNKGGKRLWDFRSNPKVCAECPLREQCLPQKTPYRTLTRWEHEDVIEAHRERMDNTGAEKMLQRAQLCEHPFGTLKLWMGWRHFLLRGLEKVRTELSLHMLAYNFRRVLSVFDLQAFRAHCATRRLARAGISN